MDTVVARALAYEGDGWDMVAAAAHEEGVVRDYLLGHAEARGDADSHVARLERKAPWRNVEAWLLAAPHLPLPNSDPQLKAVRHWSHVLDGLPSGNERNWRALLCGLACTRTLITLRMAIQSVVYANFDISFVDGSGLNRMYVRPYLPFYAPQFLASLYIDKQGWHCCPVFAPSLWHDSPYGASGPLHDADLDDDRAAGLTMLRLVALQLRLEVPARIGPVTFPEQTHHWDGVHGH